MEAEIEMRRRRDRTTSAVAIEGLLESGTLTSLNDEELLLRFRLRDDPRALELLLERYGPLVMSVCREILADSNDVDDAFQATFLILIRKSGSICLAREASRRGCTGWRTASPSGPSGRPGRSL